MGIRAFLSRPIASFIVYKQKRWAARPVQTQDKVFRYLIKEAKHTLFGKDHNFEEIQTYEDFKTRVPIHDYEELTPYINKILSGDKDILWNGKPVYFAKTSGTTSGVKYIPVTRESIPYHIAGARDALMNYIHETGNSDFLDKNLIFLSGSPEMEMKNGIHIGRLSGIVNHHVPAYLKTNQKPSYETNCIEDWETKLDKIIEETVSSPMSLISGIPPWVQMYFDKLFLKTGKKVKDLFPEFSLFVYGGVNFEPYKAKLFDSIGKKIDSVETYPASEGFIAFQDSQKEEGLLLLLNSGIFYEFMPAEEYFSEKRTRISIKDVKLGVNYALILNTNAGLWGYSIGDTVKFVSKDPFRIVVTGRIKHFISAFGEHVIGEEVEKAMKYALGKHPGTDVVEFTVAPVVAPAQGLPHHEWLVEFNNAPADIQSFENDLDAELKRLNVYYDDLIRGNILRKLKITALPKNSFIEYMRSLGKLGGQNKVPRLSNDRKLADAVLLNRMAK